MTERGTLLGGRYELDEVIGRGGMAEVWRARDTRLQRDVAVKRLRLDLASDNTFQARFRREAQAAAGLNHPNIVAVYDTGEEADAASGVMVPYIVMELIEGVTLREVLRGGRKIVPEKALEFTAGVLDALAYSHRAGIIHRDIKPANVMFTPPGTVKVMDFGIARAVADTSATMTQTAAVIGTAQYLSPEQARGQKVDNRSDIYAVGVLLYELLTSEPPFQGDSPVSVVFQHVRELPVPPSQRDPEVTPAMDTIVMRALEKDPRDRYQDASEMREDIVRVLNNQPVRPAPRSHAADTPTQVIASDPITTTARRAAPPAAGAPLAAHGVEHDAHAGPENAAETEEELEEEKSSKGPIIAISILAGLLVIGVIALLLFLNREPGGEALPSPTPSPSVSETESESPSPTPTVEKIAVPHVVGLERADAENRLRDAGLSPVVEEVSDGATEDNNGTVKSSNPDGGSEVEKGSEVQLQVYTYVVKTIEVPGNLVGMTEQQAIDELVAAGFKKEKIEFVEEETDAQPAGNVIKVTPTGAVDPDSTITLTVARESDTAEVPDFTGMTAERAQQLAEQSGFKVEVTPVPTADHPEGLVFQQSVNPGASLSKGETINLSVAQAPEEPTPSDDESDGNN